MLLYYVVYDFRNCDAILRDEFTSYRLGHGLGIYCKVLSFKKCTVFHALPPSCYSDEIQPT